MSAGQATGRQTGVQPVVVEGRTYGNWSRPRTPGLPRLGLIGTVLALGALVLVVLVQAAAGLLAGLVVAIVAGLVLAPLAWRNRAGRHGWQVLAATLAWQAGRRRRQHVYLAALAGPVAFGACRLPGLLAPSRLVEGLDGYGQPFALVHVPAARHYTVLLALDPDGSALVDQDTVDTWVAHYGRFLADLAHEPGLVAATATVETSPDPGFRLAAEVDRLLTPTAPALSAQVLGEAAATYPRGSAVVRAHVAFTFTARRPTTGEKERLARRGNGEAATSRLRTGPEMATLVGARLPGLVRALSTTGAGAARAMDAAGVAELVRTAYDPAVAEHVEALAAAGQPSGVCWEQAGPAAAQERHGSYLHEQAASVTWSMAGAPKGAVDSRVLTDLLAAHDDVTRKRVTLLYRPHDAASSAAIADADVRTALGRATTRAGEGKASESAQLSSARQAAREEAAGAGLSRFSMLVTATVADPAGLAQAAETVDQLGRASRVLLRRCYGAQSASFGAALGVGVVLPAHVSVPDVLRDYL